MRESKTTSSVRFSIGDLVQHELFHYRGVVIGSERLTGALLDRLTHHVHILEMNGESFRLIQSKKKRAHSLG